MKNNEFPGEDGTPIEASKFGGDTLLQTASQ